MVLYVIGLGMGDEKDVTVKGLEAIRGCSRLYLEAYTSVLGVDQAKLEKFYDKPITIADRNFVELDADQIYSPALTEDIGFLVVGDPFCATTHSDLQLRAEAMGVEVRVVSARRCDSTLLTRAFARPSAFSFLASSFAFVADSFGALPGGNEM